MPRDMQGSFTGGEVSPSLYGRVDTDAYHKALAECRNCFVRAHGGASNRTGFEYLAWIANTIVHFYRPRLIPFQFSTEQNYILIFIDSQIFFMRDGGLILESSQNATAITQANPGVVTIAGHGYSDGDQVYVASSDGMTELVGRFFLVDNATTNTFTMQDLYGNDVDTSVYSAFGTATVFARVYSIASPYAGEDLATLRYTQNADVMTFTNIGVGVAGYQVRDLSRVSDTNWSLTTKTFAASIAAPSAGLSVAQVGTASGSPNKTYRYVVTSVSSTDGSESVASATQTSGSINALSETYGNRISWSTVSGAEYYNVYKELNLNSGIFGWIGEADENGSPSFDDYNLGPDMSVTPPLASDPISSVSNRPAAVTYYQQRLFFGGTYNDPQTVWASKTGDYNNLDYSRPSKSSDSLEFTLFHRQVNGIKHMIGMDDLVILTSGGEWVVKADADGVLTPSNINARRQGGRGSSDVRPIEIGDSLLFIQARGSSIRDLKYKFEDDKYTGNDLSIMATHLFDNYTIVDWCYAERPYSIVWAVRSDGKLLALTYLMEHNVWGWSLHETDGEVESVASIPGDQEDEIYIIVQREVQGTQTRYIERMHSRLFQDNLDLFFVDSGLSYEAPTVSITGITLGSEIELTTSGHGAETGDTVYVEGVPGTTELNGKYYEAEKTSGTKLKLKDTQYSQYIDGSSYTAFTGGVLNPGRLYLCKGSFDDLEHLEGETLSALVDGNVEENLVVTDRALTLTNPGYRVHIGLPYTSKITTLPMDMGGSPGPRSKKKSVNRVFARLEDTRGIKGGNKNGTLYEPKERRPSLGYLGLPLITDQQEIEIRSKWDENAQITIQQDYPLPMTVLEIILEVVVE